MSIELDKTADSGDGAPARPSGELAAGVQLGKYTLERVIGSGAMGVVWSARDPDLERRVAIKVLRRADADQALRTRLLREARAMARLKHPNVLTVYEVGSSGERDYIVMELVDGGSLDTWLAAGPPPADVWAAILAAGRGLAAAHAAGLVHRDFKPHNVLRSREGRVMVTDFGLARGQGEVAAHAVSIDPSQLAIDSTATPQRSDGVLDATLTQPGQLIGTPAYMAPEQYDGAAPDPRTDQWAFCVTAWQGLTGARPYDGRTLEELRKAARAGVAGVRAKLPRGVRAVLERGLAVEPAARWPDLDALLDGLERAARAKQWRSVIIWSARGTALLVGGLTAVQLLLSHRSHPAEAPPASQLTCQPDAFAEAWTPARHAALVQRLGKDIAAAKALDDLATRWGTAYAAACAAAASPTSYARLGCLLGQRDELVAFTSLLDSLPKEAIGELDTWGQLPRVEACEGDSPVAPPLMPSDPKLRNRIVSVRARLARLRFKPPDEQRAQLAECLDAAKAIGWKPLVAEVGLVTGTIAQVDGRRGDARTAFADAADLAEQQHDYRIEATARIGTLELEADETAQPADAHRMDTIVSQARAAVQRAGDDPLLATAIDTIVGNIELARGELVAAIDHFRRARPALGRRADVAAAGMIRARMRRGLPASSDDIWHDGVNAEDLSRGSPSTLLEHAMIELAWSRGDFTAAHQRADALRQPLPPVDKIAISGRVTKRDGTPAAGARVVAWRGEMTGDASRAYTVADFEGAIATADDSGAFHLDAPKGGAVIAELDRERAMPIALGPAADKPLALALGATRSIAGTVHTSSAELTALARWHVGDATWTVRAPVAADGKFSLDGLPRTPASVVVERDGHERHVAARDHVELDWPSGTVVDVIVRGTRAEDVDVYLLRAALQPRTRADLLSAAELVPDVATAHAGPVGFATQTSLALASTKGYQPGDFHAVFRDIAAGPLTLCEVWRDDFACLPVTLKPTGAVWTLAEDK